MRNEAILLAPCGFSAGPLVIMAKLWPDNAPVALREFREAGIAIALVETLFGDAPTVSALNFMVPHKRQGLSDTCAHIDQFIANGQTVLDRG